MKVFKLVMALSDEVLVSAIVCGAYRRQYEPGVPTLPVQGTKLLAFDTAEAARYWYGNDDDALQLWEAEAPDDSQPMTFLCEYAWQDLFKRFWSGESIRATEAPEGTLACEWIKLVRRVT